MRSWSVSFVLFVLGCGSSGGSPAALAPGGGGDSQTASGSGGKAPTGGNQPGGSGGTFGGSGPLPKDFKPADVSCTPGAIKELPIGKWTALGPPGVENASYGLVGITLDPKDPRTLFVTMQDNGIWKSCDAGTTWKQLGSPGSDPDVWDSTSNFLDVPFEVAIDPADSNHMYATVGVRGNGTLAFWVSHDGAATWRKTPGFEAIAKATTSDTTDFAVDPADFNHVLVAGHSWWAGGFMNAGIIETMDGGANWVKHDPITTWPSGTNGIEFLNIGDAKKGDSKTWLNMTAGDGFWLTTDAGTNWKKVGDYSSIHGLGVLYRAPNGTLYASSSDSPVRSVDNGQTWTQDLQGLPRGYYYVIGGDGKNLYTSISENFGAMPFVSFYTSPADDGVNWTKMGGEDETFPDGAITMKYDEKNHIVYAASWKAGLIALRTE